MNELSVSMEYYLIKVWYHYVELSDAPPTSIGVNIEVVIIVSPAPVFDLLCSANSGDTSIYL